MRDIQIVSHRGRFGGSIVENTLAAFEAALYCGADIIEMDVRRTRDGVLILFHDPSPQRLLGLTGKTEDYTLAELRAQPLINPIGEKSAFYVTTLDEALDALKGRCIINLDQCWRFIHEAYVPVRDRGMEEQVLIKGRVPYDEAISWLGENDFIPRFVPVVTCEKEIAELAKLPEKACIPAVEVFAHEDHDAVIGTEFVDSVHAAGRKLWINALTFSDQFTLCAWHDDNTSVMGNPQNGWGWLIEHGADILQTDWPRELADYLNTI
ncbi:MAG: glycerophosphodiester phosphodiesterase family protein [Clostridia bacterium]|nr:glycerophosphodiester phosphodiesterase family protein [Clostridia bacterium]